MTTYYDLLADQENIRVAQEGLGYAQKLLESNQAELKMGAVAQYDVLRSQEEVADQQQVLLAAGNTFSQDAQSMKAKISKTFTAQLATVDIAPTDKLPEPHPDDVPTLGRGLEGSCRPSPGDRAGRFELAQPGIHHPGDSQCAPALGPGLCHL